MESYIASLVGEDKMIVQTNWNKIKDYNSNDFQYHLDELICYIARIIRYILKSSEENSDHKKMEIYSVLKDYFSKFETDTIFLSYNNIIKNVEEQNNRRKKINQINNIVDEIIIRASNGENLVDNQELKQEYIKNQFDVNGCIGHKWHTIYNNEFEKLWNSYKCENPY